MRVAAVALVLVVGAAVVLAFANTLNSWVLGGLLGGLAALLLSIPISLALFTLLARHQDARRRSMNVFYEDEPEFTEDGYNERVVYEAEGYLSFGDEDLAGDPRARYLLDERRRPMSGLLRLPPAGSGRASYEEELKQNTPREPRNYPRQPRYPARNLARDTGTRFPQPSQRPTQGTARRNLSTRSLAQHQSDALRMARQEAQHGHRANSDTRARRSQSTPRSRLVRQQHTPSSLSRRPLDESITRSTEQQRARFTWREEEDSGDFSTDQFYASSQHYPRRPSYPRQPRPDRPRAVDPWRGSEDDEDMQDEFTSRQTRREADRMSGSLRNPLVRRAPYLYDDDPLREEFAQQLDSERPITRRSSLYEHYQDDEEY